MMAAGSTSIEDYMAGGRLSSNIEGMSRCQSEDSLRTCGQVENGTPSTSPPYWDTDDDDDSGPKPSALYGKFTWKIENFSQINKRELRSNAFEVGGYKWYILIYPQGCDVCNHLSLFLCVANHDKLLPGWSHFAQFTIAVVNKDPKKSKYSDTLHRFWKKEHDWGWKKFMELSKVLDGFVNEDSLVIKAQVQVIREKAHRPFRCLDCQYRRELVRVYLSNVEQICRRFIEERRSKLIKLIDDKVRWSSFRAFWLGTDQIARRRMSRDKTDAILKVVVKHFFVEKEVTSTLVMDSLYSGLKALECQGKNKKGKVKLMEMEEIPAPMVRVDKDMFVLADDVLLLIEKAAVVPLPHQSLPPKDDKGPQNRTKDGGSGEEFNKDSMEREERRLTELGRRTVEIFVLAHIFSRIEVAYQEAVALKRQEELIREEEAAEQAENELKGKRIAAEKEKRTKKKQAKQKRNSRKAKDRARDGKSDTMQDKLQQEIPCDEIILEDFTSNQAQVVIEKVDIPENASDISDPGDDSAETLRPDLEDRDCSHVNWDTDASEINPVLEASGCDLRNDQMDKQIPSVVDDSSSTCSTDSVPSTVMNESYRGNSILNNKSQTSPNRGKNQGSRGPQNPPSDASRLSADAGSCGASGPEPQAVLSLQDRIQWLEQHLVEKEEEVVSLQKKLHVKDQVDVGSPSNIKIAESSIPLPTPTPSPGKKPPYILLQQPKQSESTSTITPSTSSTNSTSEPVTFKESPPSVNPVQIEKLVLPAARSPQNSSNSKREAQRNTAASKNTTAQQQASMSRSSSAPPIPAPRPTGRVISPVQAAPLLSRSVSAAGRLGTDPSLPCPSYVPQSYRNAIMGKASATASEVGLSHSSPTPSSQPLVSSAPMLPPPTSSRKDQSVRPGLTFGSVRPEAQQNQHHWGDDCSRLEPCSSSTGSYNSDVADGVKKVDIYSELRSREQYSTGVISSAALGTVTEEFPHLDIINELLDDDKIISKAAAAANSHYHPHHHHHQNFSRQYSFPGDAEIGSLSSGRRYDHMEQYYDEGTFQRVYGSTTGSPLHRLREEHYPQVDLSAYATNGQIDGLVQNQWPYGHPAPDLSMLNLQNTDTGGYYRLPDYSNMTNGYNLYHQPGNGR